MKFSDETLMAYADGELDPVARAELEAALVGDPQLARRVAEHGALRERLTRAFEPVLDEPVPRRLLSAARGASMGRSTVASSRRAPLGASQWSWPLWGALAASLIVGVLLGPLLLRSNTGTVTTRAGQLLATGALARALSQQLASGQSPQAPVQIGVSFRSRDGAYCRSFVLHAQDALAGLACREDGEWRLQVLAAAAPTAASPGGYRPAAASMPAAVTQAVDALITGEPLDAVAEASARSRAWGR